MTPDVSLFVCPRCRGPLVAHLDAYECVACRVTYPVVLDIPDFRIAPDPWIGLADDRAKGLELERATTHMDLESMVRHYWTMTPDTPSHLAERYIAHVMAAERRSQEWLAMWQRESATTSTAARAQWIDIGCGTADLAAAAGDVVDVTGIDVAFRWLVVARRRLMQRGLPVHLVCCNAEALPFPDARFDRAVSVGTIEHLAQPDAMLRESRRVLATSGRLQLRTVNRFSLLAEPHVGVWGVGWLPRRLASTYVQWRTGRPYDHHRLLSAGELARLMHDAGFTDIRVRAAAILGVDKERLMRGALGALMGVYEFARSRPIMASLLRVVAPLLDADARSA